MSSIVFGGKQRYHLGLNPQMESALYFLFLSNVYRTGMFENGIMQSNMFREMRRKRQLLPLEGSVGIVESMGYGTLARHGDYGYP